MWGSADEYLSKVFAATREPVSLKGVWIADVIVDGKVIKTFDDVTEAKKFKESQGIYGWAMRITIRKVSD